jgi:hypothetical protein
MMRLLALLQGHVWGAAADVCCGHQPVDDAQSKPDVKVQPAGFWCKFQELAL